MAGYGSRHKIDQVPACAKMRIDIVKILKDVAVIGIEVDALLADGLSHRVVMPGRCR